MLITPQVKKILEYYDGEPTAIKVKLYQLLMQGSLAGTGKIIILPVDQGFEHGPCRSFAVNPATYDPDYFFELAIKAGLTAYAAPIGLLKASYHKYAGQIPTILKLNNNNSISKVSSAPDQAITASIKDAIDLGCIGVGCTIYPGSEKNHEMMEEAAEIISKAREYGLLSVVWSYARGDNLTSKGETAIDTCAYAAHIAALLGAHIIKVKLPTFEVHNPLVEKIYEKEKVNFVNLTERVAHIVQSCFNGKRLIVFSGGAARDMKEILEEVIAINKGGGNGSIIGRNSFQRKMPDALNFLQEIINIYK